MKFVQAFSLIKQLNPSQKDFLKTKTLQGKTTLEELLEFLKKLKEYDELGDAARKQLGMVLLFCGIGIFAGIVCAATGFSQILGMVIIAVAVICAFVFGIIFSRLKGYDLPDQLRNLIVPLLTILKEDMAPNRPVEVSFDLRGRTRDKQTSDEKPKMMSGYPKVRYTRFTDEWFTFRTKLVDKTAVQLKCISFIERRGITKRSRSGKIKSKTKWKNRAVVDLSLKPPAEAAAHLAEGPVSHPDLSLSVSSGEKGKTIRGRRVREKKGFESAPPVFQLDEVLDLAAQSFGLLGTEGEGA